jgi:hypothetical protein
VVAGREVIDRPLVTKVYQEELAMVHPMISALKSGREETILQYADLDVPKEALRFQTSLQEISYTSKKQVSDEKPEASRLEQLISLLIQMGIGEDIAPTVADQALEERPEANLLELVAHIKDLEDRTSDLPIPKKSSSKAQKLQPVYVENDLRLASGEDSESVYQTLRKKGVIIELSAYL